MSKLKDTLLDPKNQNEIYELIESHEIINLGTQDIKLVPKTLRFIGKPILKLAKTLEFPSLLFTGERNTKLKSEIKHYLIILWTELIRTNNLEQQTNELQISSSATIASEIIVQKLFSTSKLNCITERFKIIHFNNRVEIPKIDNLMITKLQGIEIVKYLKQFKPTFNELKFRSNNLLDYIQSNGLIVNTEDFRFRLLPQADNNINYSVLTGSIHEHLNKC